MSHQPDIHDEKAEARLLSLFPEGDGWHVRDSKVAVVYYLSGEKLHQHEHLCFGSSEIFESPSEAEEWLKSQLLKQKEVYNSGSDNTIIWRIRPEIISWRGKADVWRAYARFTIIPFAPHCIFERCK